jgi:virginiamycin B lyase
MWFTEYVSNRIGRITTDSTHILSQYSTPSSRPWNIAAGPDGALWFTAQAGNWIGRITTDTTHAVTHYSVPTAASRPSGIAAGPDNAMWFTETYGNQIGRLALPSTGTSPPQLTSLSPNMAAVASGSPFTLTVNGSGFVAGASIQWTAPGGATTTLTTTLVSGSQLTATVPASLLTNIGTAQVAVLSGGATSNSLPFTISGAAVPALGTWALLLVALGVMAIGWRMLMRPLAA